MDRVLSWLFPNNSLHLAKKYARIFVREHSLLQEANSFSKNAAREKLWSSRNRYDQGQIAELIFLSQKEAIFFKFIILQIVFKTRKLGNITRISHL